MAKINNFIASYSDAISDLDISFEGSETNPQKQSSNASSGYSRTYPIHGFNP